MSYKRLGKAIAIVLSATLVMQTTVVYAAEDEGLAEEIILEEDYFEESYSEIEDYIEEEEQEASTEDSLEEASEGSEEYLPDDDQYEITEDITSEEDESADIEVPGNEENEEVAAQNDVSGNDMLEGNIEDQVLTATVKNSIKIVEIKIGENNTAANIEHYGLEYSKKGLLKTAALTLGTKYNKINLKAVQTRKDGSQAKDTPEWKVDKKDIVEISGTGTSISIKALKKGTAVITCKAGDGSGAKATITIKVRQAATGLEIKGQAYIVQGKSGSYSAATTPSNANNKKVVWSIKGKPQGIEITSKGKVTVDKNVNPGTTFTLVAKAENIAGVEGVTEKKEITVIKAKAGKVTLEKLESTTIGTHTVGDIAKSVTLKASTDNGETVSWKISDSKVASIIPDSNKATVTGLAKGKVTVTAYANDGSDKKATVTLNIIVPVSDLSLSVPEDRQDDKLASGGSLKFTADVGTEYGKPNKKGVQWEYQIVGYKDIDQTEEKAIGEDVLKKIAKKKYLFSFKNGEVTAVAPDKYAKQSKELWFDCKCNNYGIRITATTTDGTNLKVTRLIKRVDRNTYLKLSRGNNYEVRVGEEYPLPIVLLSENRQNKLYIDNKNEAIATLTVDSKDYVHIKGKKKGKTEVIIKTMDGSNLSVKVTINVK